LTSSQAESKGAKTFRVDFEELDRAITDGKTEGFLKISVDRRGKILGSSIIGYRGGELLQPIVLAMKHGLTLPQVADTVFAYPTMGEGLKRTAMAYQKSRLESPLGSILKKCITWLN
jgi:pyruvate/2-oxoglutarate dehydrogenase complex dihydrolipoamide dehydrogenase (E3) component